MSSFDRFSMEDPLFDFENKGNELPSTGFADEDPFEEKLFECQLLEENDFDEEKIDGSFMIV